MLRLKTTHRSTNQLRCVPGIGVSKQEELAVGDAVPLHNRPLLAEPAVRWVDTTHQLQPVAGGRLDDSGGLVRRAVVHDDHFDGRVLRGEHGAHAVFDVACFVAGGDDDGHQGAGCEWLVLAEPRMAPGKSIQQYKHDNDPRRCEQPTHFMGSRGDTTTAVVR